MAACSSKWLSNMSLRLIRLPRLRSKSKSSTSSSTTSSSSLVSPKKCSKKEQLQQVFRHFDSNGDGMISCQELQSYLEFEFQEFVRLVEVNNDNNNEADDALRGAFQMFEADKGSGCITPRGLQQTLHRLGDVRSHEDCAAMIRVFDLDGNGVLDFHEFRQMMASP